MKAAILVLALILPLQGCAEFLVIGYGLGYSQLEMGVAHALAIDALEAIPGKKASSESGPQVTLKTSNRKARAFCDKQFNDTDARKRCYGRTR